jgi:protein NrfC
MSDNEDMKEPQHLSRRQFVAGLGGVGIAGVLASVGIGAFLLPDKVLAIPASRGYLLVDSKKCQGCNTCMMACSLTHHGVVNLSLGRIQVTQDSFAKWPDDKTVSQCRQCVDPKCVRACPTGANHVDVENGNVRTIDPSKCIGCERCVAACPYDVSRASWDFEHRHAQKCDLCSNTPFWTKKLGPTGGQACKAVCPVGAISFTKEIPIQSGKGGYDVNLRDQHWKALGYPLD